jgi:hypothetical protein
MAEVLVQFAPPVVSGGRTYTVRICGRVAADGMWEGWIEFEPQDGGLTLRTPRETEQPSRVDLQHWATGVTVSYLEGAVDRARPPRSSELPPRTGLPATPAYDGPAPAVGEAAITPRPHGLAARLPGFDPVPDEVLVQFGTPVLGRGRTYTVRICGRVAATGRWEGWIEFDPLDGGLTVRTPRETEQPSRIDLQHWASGVTLSYLEGALDRALPPRADESSPNVPDLNEHHATPRGALNPYRVYSHEGEIALRDQLAALSEDQLRGIVHGYAVIPEGEMDLMAMHHTSLVELIVAAIRKLYVG